MMPTILDDDDVLVNRADRGIRQQDRIWALGYGELGMIKRVRRLPSGLFQLNSDNPAVTPIEATEDELFVVGRVIWIGSSRWIRTACGRARRGGLKLGSRSSSRRSWAFTPSSRPAWRPSKNGPTSSAAIYGPARHCRPARGDSGRSCPYHV
jgi:hypothetical protein